MRILGDHDLPDEVQTFLEAGDPPIIFTSGTAMRHDHDFFAASVAACRRIDVRGLLLTRYPEQIPNVLPGGVRHFSYVQLSNLLPRTAALVHHGGIGTRSLFLSGC
jgi:UDP:flavonoid glycosyltransferase YjiC (YdhE family)